MARLFYIAQGGVVAQVNTSDGDYAPATPTYDVYDARTGGTVVTDLIDTDGTTAITGLTPPAGTVPACYGPDGYDGGLWLQDQANPDDPRSPMMPEDIADRAASTGTVVSVAGVSPVAGNVPLDADDIADGTTGKQFTVTEKSKLAGVATGATANSTDAFLRDLANATGQLDATTMLTNLADAVAAFMADSIDPTPDTVARRRIGTGAVAGGTAIADDECLPLGQARSLYGGGAAAAAVTSQRVTSGLPLSSSLDGTFNTLPAGFDGIKILGASSGNRYRMNLWVAYRAVTLAGIEWRFKATAAAATNRLGNPGFNTDATGWNAPATLTLARDTGSVQEGSGSLKVTVGPAVTVATNISIWSDYVTANVGDIMAAAAQLLRGTATARNVRVDVQFADATGTNASSATGVLASWLGTAVSPATGAWTRAFSDAAHRTGTAGVAQAGSGVTQARVRITFLSVLAGDIFYVDAAQLEPGDPVVAYGNTGGGSSVLDIQGEFAALPSSGGLTPTSPKVGSPIRFPAVATRGVQAQGHASGAGVDATLVGAFDIVVGGTGLTGQTVEPEWAQMAPNGTATQIMAAHATIAKVA